MSSLNVSSYLHIYIGLFDNKIQFGRQQAALPVGEAILQFIYYDFKPIVNRLHYSIDDFSPAHPFFRASSPQWQLAFINHIEKNDKAGDMPSLQYIIQLQDKYRHMMETLYESQSIADQKKFRDYTAGDDWISRQNCFSNMRINYVDTAFTAVDYLVTSLDECLLLEFTELLRRRISYKVCKNCGRLFIPKRSNTDYCSRIVTEDGKTCAEVGYTKTFNRNVRNDELLQAYTRAYKAHYARMSKPRKRVANMTREEFEEWYAEAKDKLNRARRGEIDGEEFKRWLKI